MQYIHPSGIYYTCMSVGPTCWEQRKEVLITPLFVPVSYLYAWNTYKTTRW